MLLIEPTPADSAPTQPDHGRPSSAVCFELSKEIDELEGGPQYVATGHAARSLFRRPSLRVVLIVLRRHAELKEHSTNQPVALQVLKGSIRVALPDRAVEHGEGELVVIESGVLHDVIALSDSAFLLSMPWSAQGES